MRSRGRITIAAITLAALSSVRPLPLPAAEPYQKFLDGLKERGYSNTALEYLQTIESDPGTPAEFKQIIPYERAQLLIQAGARTVSLDEQRAQLDQAEKNLDQFLKANPNHPLAGQANADRSELLLRRAQVDLWDAEAATKPGEQKDLQNRARGYLNQAKALITSAIDQHDKAAKAFPTFIPETEKAKREERDAAQDRLMLARLKAAEIAYWMARSYPPGPERKKGLEAAVAAYEAVVQMSRQRLAGNYALVWQGKCYEELGDVGKALGIFKQVLEHDDNQPAMQELKDTTLRFRLVCLNSDQRKDYGVVTDEAEAWMRDNPSRITSAAGLGIQWELCRALEAQGNDRNHSDTQRRADLNQALERARLIGRFAGEHKADAMRLVQKLTVSLDRKGAAPKDFEGAYAAGFAVIEDAGKAGDAYRAAVAKGDNKAAADIMRTIRASGDEAAKLFRAALAFRTPRTEPEKAATARLQLAYAYFLQGRYLDCATIAEHQMRTFVAESPDVAREAGFLAMSALDAAMASGTAGMAFENEWMASIGQHMVKAWPESDRSQEARMLLGRTAWSQQNYVDAAKWWTSVPATSPQFATAQISAGQAYWKRYVELSQASESARPSADELSRLKQQAIDALGRGIGQRQSAISATANTPDDLVLGKLVLAQIRNLDGQFKGVPGRAGAIELLTKGPHAVVDAVDVADGEERPTDGMKAKSAKVASFAYQQLLRSYVGVRDLDAARGTMRKLEKVAGSENPQALTAIYVEFGRELQRELHQLRAIGESDRATKTRRAFEEFLNDLAARSDGQSLSSLLWIAETYAGLADDAKNSTDGARPYVEKSAAIYQRILSRADEPGFLPSPQYKLAIRLNLAVNQRRQQDFSGAEQTLSGLLTENSSAPDVQAEAAMLYEEWGIADVAQGQQRLLTAIAGRRSAPEIWGWSKLIQRVQREPVKKRTEALNQLLLDARAHLASAEIAMAKAVTAPDARTQHLDKARHAVFSFIRSTPTFSDSEYDRFNRLYATILKDLGQPVTPLPRDANEIAKAMSDTRVSAAAGNQPAAAVATKAIAKPPASTGVPWLVPVIVGAGLAAAGGLVFYWYRQNSEKRRRRLERRRTATARPAG